jgi:hypothetical protein
MVILFASVSAHLGVRLGNTGQSSFRPPFGHVHYGMWLSLEQKCPSQQWDLVCVSRHLAL